MGSKEKETVLQYRAGIEIKLKERRAYLLENGVEAGGIAKDAAVRKLRARMREANARLKTIDTIAARTEELARVKAEKLAAPKKQKKEKAPEASAASESGKKKKKKKKKEAAAEE